MIPIHRRNGSSVKSQNAFTLIEVLVSVVILVVVGTSILLVLQGAQQGSLSAAENNQTLGLATTIAEDIKDHYTNNQTAFTINIPADALGDNTASGTYPISVPLPGQRSQGNLMDGYGYTVTCAYESSADNSSNGTSNNSTTGGLSNYDAIYTIVVQDAHHHTANLQVPVHGLDATN